MKSESLTTSALAYLGDAVFELCVRRMLLAETYRTLSKLNFRAKQYVSARAQAALYHKIFSALTEEEQAVMKRGRNLNTTSRAKNANVSDYRHATGLETLFGYLYTEGRYDRIEEVFIMCVSDDEKGRENEPGI